MAGAEIGARVYEPPEYLEARARKMFYQLRNAATVAMISREDLAAFCQAYYQYDYWRQERQFAIMYGQYKIKEQAERELKRAAKILHRYDRTIMQLISNNERPHDRNRWNAE